MNCLIIGPGGISPRLFNEYMKISDYVIACDRGARHFKNQYQRPDLYIGDFDSIDPKDCENIPKDKMIHFPKKKDYTDFELALKYTPDQSTIYALGFLGGRLDHELANIMLLKKMYDEQRSLIILNENNEISWLEETQWILAKHKYLSIIPLTSMEISMEGVAYPLNHRHVQLAETLTISNEIRDEKALIKVHEGYGILIQAEDPIRGKELEAWEEG
ncbi:MAG: thiamine diphosphokinase [Tissierellia bacterium]|nr:thiamine diphosphokinase [Tissierellia bacterium]